MHDIDMIAQLADLKEVDYRNTLAIAALIELLIEKDFFSRRDFTCKAKELDQSAHKKAESMASRNREPGTGNRGEQLKTRT